MAAKIKKGDKVVVITSRDKGRSGGRAGHADRGPNDRARHQRGQAPPAPDHAAEGGIITKEPPSTCPISPRPIPRTASPRVGFKSE